MAIQIAIQIAIQKRQFSTADRLCDDMQSGISPFCHAGSADEAVAVYVCLRPLELLLVRTCGCPAARSGTLSSLFERTCCLGRLLEALGTLSGKTFSWFGPGLGTLTFEGTMLRSDSSTSLYTNMLNRFACSCRWHYGYQFFRHANSCVFKMLVIAAGPEKLDTSGGHPDQLVLLQPHTLCLPCATGP